MKKILLLLPLTLIATLMFAQTYQDKAAEVQKIIWGEALPEFAIKEVPAKYANESAVILAQSYKMQRSSVGKFKYFIITAMATKRETKITTFHERVKINDKSALEDYSSLAYQKKSDRTTSLLLSKMVNTHETYIGAKIIKPTGQEISVNTSEEVLMKNTSKEQQGKLAIPGLQVGDILDYYICNNDVSENSGNEKANTKVFMLVAEYPIMNYSLEFQMSNKVNMTYITANGAPRLVESNPTKDDRLLSLKLTDVPKYEGQMWTSMYRQFPYIQLSDALSKNVVAKQSVEPSTLDNPSPKLTAIKTDFERLFNETYFPGFKDPLRKLKEHFSGNKGISPMDRLKERFEGNKALKAASLDSITRVLHDIWRHNVFGSYSAASADNIADLNYRTANSKINAVAMSLLLTDQKINHDILLVSSRFNSTIANAFDTDDVEAMIRVNTDAKPIYMCFSDAFTQFNEIPVKFQGEQVITLSPERKSGINYRFTEGTATLPVSNSTDNLIDETLTVSLPPANMQKLDIVRHVKQGGYMRHNDQMALLSPADVDKAFMDKVKGDDLEYRLKHGSDTKKLSDAFLAGMTRSAAELKKAFSDEVKSNYEQEPQNISDYAVINQALDSSDPFFEFKSSFTLDNLVKKAGNNYIVEAGKLTGSFIKLEEKDRKPRTADIYMPGARAFKYTINIAIPKGYHVKGVEELNKQKSNKTGMFSSTATVNNGVLTITVNRSYTNNFEKAADWPLLTELIDSAAQFTDQKILMEKEG